MNYFKSSGACGINTTQSNTQTGAATISVALDQYKNIQNTEIRKTADTQHNYSRNIFTD